MIYPKLSDGTIDWCAMCKHRGSDIFDLCCMCNYIKDDDPPSRYEPIAKPTTNADRLRTMSDEEIAEFADDMCELLCGAPLVCMGQCKQKMLKWLKEETDDGTGKK